MVDVQLAMALMMAPCKVVYEAETGKHCQSLAFLGVGRTSFKRKCRRIRQIWLGVVAVASQPFGRSLPLCVQTESKSKLTTLQMNMEPSEPSFVEEYLLLCSFAGELKNGFHGYLDCGGRNLG